MSDFLTEMREFISAQLKANSIQEELAEKVSKNIAIIFRQNFGGIPIYIHKSKDHSVRNAEIYRKFNGRNTHELCREYRLCYQQICKIIKNERNQRKSH
jgi:Mor family transcriptional regulator